jgi:hypothetical protein
MFSKTTRKAAVNMGSVNPTTALGVLIIMVAITQIICTIINTINGSKRKPTLDSDLGSIDARLRGAEKELQTIRETVSRNEDKISRQVAALHERINTVLGELKEISGMMKNHLSESRQ